MEKVYFISDVHLDSRAREIEKNKTAQLTGFLSYVRTKADFLYIVGDLFDFWFEYRHAIPKVNLKILFKLLELVESGVRINYLAGNHDIWVSRYLEKEMGIEIIHEPLQAKHNALNLFVAHGDGLVTQDRKQRFLNRIFKNPANILLYRLLHPDIGIPLAKFISKKSHEKRCQVFEDAYRKFANEKLNDGYDGVILGHTHQPLFERVGPKFYANLGNWIEDFTYLELSDQHVELKTWSG